ncbi:hypothetical protein ACFLWE_01625 [Chloroflexota bacterium]
MVLLSTDSSTGYLGEVKCFKTIGRERMKSVVTSSPLLPDFHDNRVRQIMTPMVIMPGL